MLGFVARHANEGPQTAAMLEALDGVRVRVYRVGPEAEQVQLHQALNSSVRRLSDGDWQVAMRVVEDDSIVHVLVREEEGDILGFALVSADDEELVLVNVMGRFDAATLNALAETLDDNLTDSFDDSADDDVLALGDGDF